MENEFAIILRKLDRKQLVSWVPEMRAGKPVYDYLLKSLRTERLSRHQRANILHALFRLRDHGSEEEVYALMLEHSHDQEKRVRSEAVKLLIGISRLHGASPPFDATAYGDELIQAIELGVDIDTERLAKKFLGLSD